MQMSSKTADNLSKLCVRVATLEDALNLRKSKSTSSGRTNPTDKINKLCRRIVRIEKLSGIKKSTAWPSNNGQFGPSGNALLANNVNMLCARVVRIENRLSRRGFL